MKRVMLYPGSTLWETEWPNISDITGTKYFENSKTYLMGKVLVRAWQRAVLSNVPLGWVRRRSFGFIRLTRINRGRRKVEGFQIPRSGAVDNYWMVLSGSHDESRIGVLASGLEGDGSRGKSTADPLYSRPSAGSIPTETNLNSNLLGVKKRVSQKGIVVDYKAALIITILLVLLTSEISCNFRAVYLPQEPAFLRATGLNILSINVGFFPAKGD